ncbi:DNA alkylation repair protein [Candidatus Saccharibacteria bacterium]|nr:DNA alkylation repair protein [Candidatus Saccharibacteria bacterium]
MKEVLSYSELRSELAANADEGYREFSMKGIPSERPFIGVRIPKIREIVKRVPEEKFPEFLAARPVAIEEVLARGMIIARMKYPEMVSAFDSQVELISDWCTCDTFCAAIRKKVAKNREEFYETKISKLLSSSEEFSTRVGIVLLLGYVSAEWLQVIFEEVEKLSSREEYYVRMGVAWLVAECFIKFPEETLSYMKVSKLPAWTYNKAISKICDSYRVSGEAKNMLRKMRR